jgi:hypothetical protein
VAAASELNDGFGVPPLVSVEANENLDDSADNLLRWSGEIYASIKGFTTR